MFSLKVLDSFSHEGHIERTVTDIKTIQVPARMSTALRDYELYCRDRRLRTTTLRARMRVIALFAEIFKLVVASTIKFQAAFFSW
ncbi:hypothetical protein P5W98_03285 [Paraburkholderia sp. A1BS-2L]|uniref:hypothetical protein n=1 Tax=Paraburkholderia sp. A1BS-2L TaxID=3028373 RepID=UPI003DA97939